MFGTRLRIPRVRLAARPQQRSVHSVPTLRHDFSKGVPGLLSADGFDMAWKQHMTYTLSKLNALTEGTDLETRDTKHILHATARDPDQAPVFNHASMAHNTHFFFNGLSPVTKTMSAPLEQNLIASFSSIATFRREMILTAASMFGPGFVWLVKTAPPPAGAAAAGTLPGSLYGGSSNSRSIAPAHEPEFKVLTTYLAGTPYPGAHWRLQPADMNTVGAEGTASPYIRGAQQAAAGTSRPPGSLEVIPLLCLSTWDHTYLRDYGVGGKRAFAEAWWDSVDWDVVADLASIRARPSYQV